jgi:hypothetical protein
MVVDQIRWCLIFTKQARLPDCALWGADTPENRQAVAEKREDFREGIEQAVAEFVRVLNFASAMEDVNARIAGHPLRAWFRGAHLPEATEIPVRIVEEDGRVHLAPDAQTAARFMSRRLPVPRIEVRPAGGGDEEKGGRQEAEGSGFGVRGDGDGEAARMIAFRAFEMATRLDENPRQGKPTHAVVLGMYCVKELSINEIAKACGCAHGTIVNRKRELERKLGLPLETFRKHSAMLEEAERTAEDGRAKEIYRRGLGE